MIQRLEVHHFRCFDSLDIKNLQRVNVIVGGNGTGKTALLESVFLASGGSPELGLRLQSFRGIAAGTDISGAGLRGLWEDLFHNFDQKHPVNIKLKDNINKRPRSLTIELAEREEMSLPIEEYEAGSGIVRNIPIDFTWADQSGSHKVRPVIENGRINFPSVPAINAAVFFPAHFKLSAEETARRLSDLSKEGGLEGMLRLVREVYGEVEDLSVEHHAGAWQVFVKLEHRPHRIPLGLHSAGAAKFVAVMLGIARMEGGTVLIDEVENGFYYDRMSSIWEAIYAVAAESRCQLFISTHSRECLQALIPVLEKRSKHFTLLKTSQESGQVRVFQSEGDVMAAAIESGFELR